MINSLRHNDYAVVDKTQRNIIISIAETVKIPVHLGAKNESDIIDYPNLCFSDGEICGLIRYPDESYRELSIGSFIDLMISYKHPFEIQLTEDYKAVISQTEVRVGCQFITFEKVEEVYNAIQKMK